MVFAIVIKIEYINTINVLGSLIVIKIKNILKLEVNLYVEWVIISSHRIYNCESMAHQHLNLLLKI